MKVLDVKFIQLDKNTSILTILGKYALGYWTVLIQ